MAVSIAKLAIMLTTDTSGMMRGFAQAESAITGFNASTMGVTAALTGLAAAEVAFIQEGVRMKMTIENIRIQLDTLSGSAEVGSALMTQFVSLSRSTPFNIEDVAMSGKILMAMGSSAGQVSKQILMLGNVAAGTGQNVRQLAQVFGEVQNAGRLTSNELRQFNMRGVPLMAELTEMFGVSEVAIRKMAEEGTISADAVEEAFARMGGAGGKFDGLMEKLSNSMQGRWEKLKEAFSMSAFEVVGGNRPFGPANQAMSAAEQFLDNVAMGAKGIHKAMATGNPFLLDPMRMVLDQIAEQGAAARILADQGKKDAVASEGKRHMRIIDEMFSAEQDAFEDHLKALKKEADKISRALFTPSEVMADHLSDANEMLKAGFLDAEMYHRQLKNISDEFKKASKEGSKLRDVFRGGMNPGVDFNSSAGASAIGAAKAEMARMVHEQKQSNIHLNKIEKAFAGVASF